MLIAALSRALAITVAARGAAAHQYSVRFSSVYVAASKYEPAPFKDRYARKSAFAAFDMSLIIAAFSSYFTEGTPDPWWKKHSPLSFRFSRERHNETSQPGADYSPPCLIVVTFTAKATLTDRKLEDNEVIYCIDTRNNDLHPIMKWRRIMKDRLR